MVRFHEQMKDRDTDIEPNNDWTLDDYKDFHICVKRGYLVQDGYGKNSFMINEEWDYEEAPDFYKETFGDLKRIQ